MSHRLPPVAVLRVALLAGAGWALWRQLRGTTPGEITDRLARYGLAHVALAIGLTVASFLLLGVIEVLALRASAGAGRHGVSLRTALTTGFVANALSQSIGLAVLTGAAVRARAYGRRGMSAPDIAEVSAFVTLTATLGLLAAAAVALVTEGGRVSLWKYSVPGVALGLLLALPVLAYIAWSILGRRAEVGIGRWKLRRPATGIAVSQVIVSTIDWVVTGGVLFVFLASPSSISFPGFLKAYALAQTAAASSHVPGGAGVLELVLLAQLARAGDTGSRVELLAGLVMFRVVYYLLPLVVAASVAAISELRGRRSQVAATRWSPGRTALAEEGAA